ncbi:MAG: helix-turn-helix transcriptional regulator [Prevotella sp.]|nr:helix-turn-helix transcriptional regulator [Prevotella sp.]
MKRKHLPGSLGDRVRELRERDKLTQGELAARIGTSASTLSWIEKGDIESPGSDIVVKLARVFRVSTDFLLGVTDYPDRKNYDVRQLGLSPEAVRRLNSGEVDVSVLNRMVTNLCFPTISRNISSYLDGSLEAGMRIQNDMIASAMDMTRPFPTAQMELSAMKMPSSLALERLVMRMELMLRSMKKDADDSEHADQQELDSQVARDVQREIYALRKKGKPVPPESIADVILDTVTRAWRVDAHSLDSFREPIIQLISRDIAGEGKWDTIIPTNSSAG